MDKPSPEVIKNFLQSQLCEFIQELSQPNYNTLRYWHLTVYDRIAALEAENKRLTEERDGFNALRAECLMQRATLKTQLTAALEREKVLREALIAVRIDLVQRSEMDSEDGGAILNISNGILHKMNEALSTKEPT